MVSFILPAHNEERWIRRSIAAIRTAMEGLTESHEVIVVDDASDDATARLAEQDGARVVRVAHRQIAAARNAGAREARGELLFFVDADTLATSGAVRAALGAMREGAAGGGCVFRFDGTLPWGARLLYPVAVVSARCLRLVGGCFLFCTRKAFDNAGGFCEQFYAAEEAAFIRALKKQGRFIVPRETVITSGRKLRAYSTWRIVREAARWFFRGPESYRRREGLEIWYGPRQEDKQI
jgi:glycosyltransferase involved in cell wall biosynthesis